jgi:hypothetical protein
MLIPDPNFSHPGSRIQDQKDSLIRIKEYKYFLTKKNCSKALGKKYDLGCSSQIRIPDPYLDFLSIPDPGVE